MNCEFMSVAHDGHLSLQFALYQLSFRFLCAEPPPQLFLCSFESMSPISAPGSESSREIARRFRRVTHCRDIACAGFPDFPRPQIQPPFLGRRDSTYVIAKQMSIRDAIVSASACNYFLFHYSIRIHRRIELQIIDGNMTTPKIVDLVCKKFVPSI